MPTLQNCLPENNCCPCGAAVDPGKRRCRKCRARPRWRHRHVYRSPPVTPRRGGIRPAVEPPGPRGGDEHDGCRSDRPGRRTERAGRRCRAGQRGEQARGPGMDAGGRAPAWSRWPHGASWLLTPRTWPGSMPQAPAGSGPQLPGISPEPAAGRTPTSQHALAAHGRPGGAVTPAAARPRIPSAARPASRHFPGCPGAPR
jgi:hypothetical protein